MLEPEECNALERAAEECARLRESQAEGDFPSVDVLDLASPLNSQVCSHRRVQKITTTPLSASFNREKLTNVRVLNARADRSRRVVHDTIYHSECFLEVGIARSNIGKESSRYLDSELNETFCSQLQRRKRRRGC